MIRVEKIQIEEFRGIRDLTLVFNGRSFGICGPNGTGKSGIVDAIEFGLTGGVSRLSGEGTGDVSVREHGPHVDSRNRPDKARVILTLSIPSLKKTVTIDRTVKNAGKPTVTPDEPSVQAVLAQVALHPEFVLSRRELISYVITSPGNRSAEVQALLRLDQVEKVRGVLTRISNAAAREASSADREQRRAADGLMRALEIAQPAAQKVLEAANGPRKLLGLPPLASLSVATALTEGLSTSDAGAPSRIVKAKAMADLQSVRDSLVTLSVAATRDDLAARLTSFASESSFIEGTERDQLLRTALRMFNGEACPVCEKPWQPNEFRRHIESRRDQLADIAKQRIALEAEVEPAIVAIDDALEALRVARAIAGLTTPVTDVSAIDSYRGDLEAHKKQLSVFLPLAATVDVLNRLQSVPAGVSKTISLLDDAVAKLPEPSAQAAARDFLVRGQERLETYRDASQKLRTARDHAQTAKTVSDVYATASTEALESIYKQVEGKFSEYYRFINSDDEKDFSAQLTPSLGKLGFDVDFYGRGMFPPGAYHSEGHQDGMGLCLYLALMDHLLGDGFTFAVLDDVLMSVDAGHRREVCRLLKAKFPNTQFILTTHDRIWLRHMKSEGLIRASDFIHFRSWDVSRGPTEWDARDVWQEIEEDLKRDDVRSAAAMLRNYLEYIAAEICHWLRAPVEFRGDAQYQLGDLLPSAIGQYVKLMKAGKGAAQSWQQQDLFSALNVQTQAFSALVAASEIDNWQVNPAVHFNNWENLNTQDFAPVVMAYKRLIEAFFCSACGAPFYVLPDRGEKEELRCSCGKVHINLKKKAANKNAA